MRNQHTTGTIAFEFTAQVWNVLLLCDEILAYAWFTPTAKSCRRRLRRPVLMWMSSQSSAWFVCDHCDHCENLRSQLSFWLRGENWLSRCEWSTQNNATGVNEPRRTPLTVRGARLSNHCDDNGIVHFCRSQNARRGDWDNWGRGDNVCRWLSQWSQWSQWNDAVVAVVAVPSKAMVAVRILVAVINTIHTKWGKLLSQLTATSANFNCLLRKFTPTTATIC